jgi:hypothetical protein
METTTPNLLTAYQTNRLAEHSETMERAFKVLNGGRALGLEMLDLDVIGGFRARSTPNDPGESVVAYAHQDAETSLAASTDNPGLLGIGPLFTVIRRDEDHEPLERLLVTVGYDTEARRDMIGVLGRTEAEALSPADTAIELTEEDVEPLEEIAEMFVPLQATGEHCEKYDAGTLPFLEGVLGEHIPSYGHGVERDGTLYVISDETGALELIRPDGTILPVGHSMNEPSEKLDGEREEIIRPRIEELREQIETRREEALEEMTPEERKAFYMAQDMEGESLDPVEWLDKMPDPEKLMGS